MGILAPSEQGNNFVEGKTNPNYLLYGLTYHIALKCPDC